MTLKEKLEDSKNVHENRGGRSESNNVKMRVKKRCMMSRVGWGWALLIGCFFLVACGGVKAPDGFQMLEHSAGGSVAVPEEWVQIDIAEEETGDPDAIEVQLPDAPEDVRLGATLFLHPGGKSPMNERKAESVAVLYSRTLLTRGGGDQIRRESVEIEGAADAFLIQIAVESPPLDGAIVNGTYVSAANKDGRTMVLRLLGTEKQISNDLVTQIVETLNAPN